MEVALRSFGLTANEARAYLALLGLGRQTPAELAPRSHVSRGRIYQILAELERKGFVVEVPGAKRAYQSVDPKVALGTAVETERARVRERERLLEALVPKLSDIREDGGVGHPAVEVLRRSEQIIQRFEQLQRDVSSEVLIFTKAPLLTAGNPAGIDALRRGVRYATLYEKELLDVPSFRPELEVWLAAGEEARVVDRLPAKMAVFDRRLALLMLPWQDPATPFMPVVVHDTGLAEMLGTAFDRLWDAADPISFEELRSFEAARTHDPAS